MVMFCRLGKFSFLETSKTAISGLKIGGDFPVEHVSGMVGMLDARERRSKGKHIANQQQDQPTGQLYVVISVGSQM